MSRLLGEILRLYDGEAVPPPAAGVRDLVAWTRERSRASDRAAAHAHWRSCLAALPAPTRLTAILPPPQEPGPDGAEERVKFAAIAALVPGLLRCVAVYSLADAVNVTVSFALRGAGDTRFVTWLTFALAWPVMVLPTAVVVTWRSELAAAVPGMGDPLYWAWGFATAFIILMAGCFVLRFRTGKWKTMRVIEPGVAEV